MKPIYQKKFLETYAINRRVSNINISPTFVIILILVIIVSLLYVWQKVEISSLGYEIGLLEKQTKELTERNENLKIKCEKLRSLDRIEKIAKDRLNMHFPNKIKIIPRSDIKEKE
ncbi:cell division protein FtsL [Candidatus Poribacteria bacterium]|nr:cell division protein FtsL [Candidatus Poribacteria bacterium]